MKRGNTYTYSQSNIPAIRPEIQAEIAEIDFKLGNLNLRIQGNYRELESLAECLENNMDSCESAMNSIRIVPDGDFQSGSNNEVETSAISYLDLPLEQKQLIYARIAFFELLMEAYTKKSGLDRDTVSAIMFREFAKLTPPSKAELDEFFAGVIEIEKSELESQEYTQKLTAILTPKQGYELPQK